MITALEVQKMLGVADLDVIAHGYTYERHTVDIWFENGRLIRSTEPYMKDPKIVSSDFFEPEYFHGDIKRFYRDRTNEKLIALCHAFGGELQITG